MTRRIEINKVVKKKQIDMTVFYIIVNRYILDVSAMFKYVSFVYENLISEQQYTSKGLHLEFPNHRLAI